jgi:hypothetical protein
MPVRWTTSWPLAASDPAEARELGRELASSIEARFRVIGVVSFATTDTWSQLSAVIAERLVVRGHTVAELVLRSPSEEPSERLAEALESKQLRVGVAMLAAQHDFVLVSLPPLHDREAYRVATSLVEGIVVVVESGELAATAAAEMEVALEFPRDRTLVVAAAVAPELLPRWGRRVGEGVEEHPARPQPLPTVELPRIKRRSRRSRIKKINGPGSAPAQ